MNKYFLKTMRIIALLYFVALLGLYFFQEKLIFKNHHDAHTQILELNAFGFDLVKNESDHIYIKTTPKSKAWLLIFHGNSSTARDKVPLIQKILNKPLNFAIIEYPGYDNAPGKPSETSILDQSLRTFDFLKKENNLPIIVFGESLGTGPATYLASKKPVAGLILQTPYTSIAEVAANRYPMFPVKWLIRHSLKAKDWAPNVKAPTLVLHGTKDRVISYENGRSQFENFKSEKRMVTIKDSGHMYYELQKSPLYWSSTIKLIEQIIN